MTMRSSLVFLVMVIAACAPPPIELVGDTANGSEDGGADAPMDDDSAGGMEPGDGGMVVDGMVDCSTLPPGGPMVAGGDLAPTGFPEFACNPRADGGLHANGYNCCSVDPAAEGGGLPSYAGKNIQGGNPYFSGDNNELGTWGMCVRTGDIPFGSALIEAAAASCPIPCNPTWDDESIDVVCGENRRCCQTHVLTPMDCVQDQDGIWRAVSGADIGSSTDWNPSAHETHQDPGGVVCTGYASGDQTSPIFFDCIEQLSVADQRGVCMALQVGQACPSEQPSFVDACELLNE